MTAPHLLGDRRASAPARVVLADESSIGLPLGELESVAAALQTLIDRDFAPVWGIGATIAAVADEREGGPDAWPMRLLDPVPNVGGVHLHGDGGPYAEVGVGEGWTMALSHELMEMLVDPFGDFFVTAPSIDPLADGRPVRYLVEVCGPCMAEWHLIGGVQVSDFSTPAYWGLGSGSPPYDLLGRVRRPFEIAPGGAVYWWDPADGLWHEGLWSRRFVTAEVQQGAVSARDDRDQALGFRRARG